MSAADGTLVAVSKIVDHGRNSHRSNLVFLAEGYMLGDLPNFIQLVDEILAEMRVTRPFHTLWPNFNAHRIEIASSETGADIPTTGLKVRTFFDATFGTGCSERQLQVDDRAVLKFCNTHIAEHSAAIVIVNSQEHGGSSGDVIALSAGIPGSKAWGVMHELGHLLAPLDDEYNGATDCPGHLPQARFHGAEPVDANVTTVRDSFNLKWSDLVGVATPPPTLETDDCVNPTPKPSPFDEGTVGLFEGAGRFNCGLFRSEFDCRMRHRGRDYCEVCTRTLTRAMSQFGPRPAELSRNLWTSGWDMISAIEIDGSPHLVSYKPASGSISVDRVRADATGTDQVMGSTWSTGWTSIVPLQLDGQPHLLLYKAGSGQVEIDAITNGGQDIDPVWTSTWSTGWTTIVPFTLAGAPHIFSYKIDSGSVSIARVGASGTDPEVLGSTWNTGWSHFALWEQPWGASLVSYRTSDGSLELDRILNGGQDAETIIETRRDAGATSLVPLTWHGEPLLVLHTMSDGTARFDHLHDPGPNAAFPPWVSTLEPSLGKIAGHAWSGGWQSLTPFMLVGDPYWVAYNGSVAVIDRID